MQYFIFSTIYTLTSIIGLPFAVLRLLWKSRKNAAYRQRLSERFAYHLPINKQPCIWIHTVSVGEFLATLPLIERLLNHTDAPLLITTTTPTGSALVTQKLGNRVKHCYLPFDVPFLVKRFIKKTQPQTAVFVETEIWPNYIKQLHKQRIPTLLINARLSEKSFTGYQKLGKFTQMTLSQLTIVACQNQITEARFRQLGANTQLLGNMKFDLQLPTNFNEKQLYCRQALGDTPFILAASTHRGEEKIIIEAYQNSTIAQSHRLAIAPRHPERSAEIIALCNQHQLSSNCYTELKAKSNALAHLDVLVIDTLGDLLTFYALSKLAIIGGSFVEHGGHNPLEAALFQTPIIMGNHTFNFETLIKEMSTHQALTLTDSNHLTTTLNQYASEPEIYQQQAQNARRYLQSNQGATDNYLKLILKQAKSTQR